MKGIVQVVGAAGVMAIVTVALGGVKFVQISRAIAEHENFAMPPESVTSALVTETVWRPKLETIGSFAAVQGVTLSAEEAGKVARIFVESGAKVEKGQQLIELDTAVEEANLKAASARLELARQNLSRAMSLKNQSAMSAATVEDAQSKFRQAEAEAASTRAIIERKRIVAPFAGRAGIRVVNLGQYVGQGAPLLPLYSVDPIYINFSVPQKVVGKITSKSKVTLGVDAFPGVTFEGQVTAINPNINESTRNVDVQATISNAAEQLKPGMFARITVDLGEEAKVLVIPTSGITYAPYGDAVYVVEMMKDKSGKEYKGVRQVIVHLGEQRGDFTRALSGLKVGEEVVTTGSFKLRPLVAVNVNNSTVPPNSEAPTVQDS